MAPWIINAVTLTFALVILLLMATALLWRVGSWQIHPAATLNLDEGLRIDSEAPQIAVFNESGEFHLDFSSGWTFLVFGTAGCDPCAELLEVGAKHPATKWMRRVYVGDEILSPGSAGHLSHWEAFRFHDEDASRLQWRAPVSPFFFVIADGRIAAKGIGNKPSHLDRLLSIKPPLAAKMALIGQPEGEIHEIS